MPIYAYKCAECGADTEVLQRVSDTPLKDCPQCGRPALVKQVTAAGFQLKGSGWYVTDFKGKSAPAKGDSAKVEGGQGKADTKADAKSESKSESGDTKSATPPAPPPASGSSS
jgi:putative FmdB family regulatory protein